MPARPRDTDEERLKFDPDTLMSSVVSCGASDGSADVTTISPAAAPLAAEAVGTGDGGAAGSAHPVPSTSTTVAIWHSSFGSRGAALRISWRGETAAYTCVSLG